MPSFLALWFAMATLAPIAPEQEADLLPLTRYLRGKGMALSAADLLFHQAILQGSVRPALLALSGYDAILSPTLALPPRPVGWFDEVEPAENFIRQTQFTPWTALYNLSGQPAVSVPLHWTDDGLPIGVMLAGRMGDEGDPDLAVRPARVGPPVGGQHPPLVTSPRLPRRPDLRLPAGGPSPARRRGFLVPAGGPSPPVGAAWLPFRIGVPCCATGDSALTAHGDAVTRGGLG